MTLPLCADSFRGCARALQSLVTLATGWAIALGANAAEIRVLAAADFKPVLAAMAPGFEKRTGHSVVIGEDTAEALVKRIRGGEAFDLAILPPAQLEVLGKDGEVSDNSITPLARAPARAGQPAAIFAGAVSASAADSNAALSLLILLASEETQAVLKDKGMLAP